jgi:hypothetical protein
MRTERIERARQALWAHQSGDPGFDELLTELEQAVTEADAERIVGMADERRLDGFRLRGAMMAAFAVDPQLFADPTPQAAVCAHGEPFAMRGPNEQAGDCEQCREASHGQHRADIVAFENPATGRTWKRCRQCSRALSYPCHSKDRWTQSRKQWTKEGQS